jgi:hypothetical protein
MPNCCDARCPVHIDPDITLLSYMWRPGMDPNSHLDRTGSQALDRLRGRLERSRRRRESHEERVALRVHLDSAMSGEGLAQDAAMLVKRLRVLNSAQLTQQPGRALNVSEEEGHRPGREVQPHSNMMRQEKPRRTGSFPRRTMTTEDLLGRFFAVQDRL